MGSRLLSDVTCPHLCHAAWAACYQQCAVSRSTLRSFHGCICPRACFPGNRSVQAHASRGQRELTADKLLSASFLLQLSGESLLLVPGLSGQCPVLRCLTRKPGSQLSPVCLFLLYYKEQVQAASVNSGTEDPGQQLDTGRLNDTHTPHLCQPAASPFQTPGLKEPGATRQGRVPGDSHAEQLLTSLYQDKSRMLNMSGWDWTGWVTMRTFLQ